MQKDRWQEINRIFHAALELPPDERPGFVSTSAAQDPDLQLEVERLLEADRDADSYLESPLIPPGAFTAAFSDAPLLRAGDILCERFHILRFLGAGGMGHVFEAHDSELAVNVALKLIRPEIASNPQALARFRQEVRLARRITHPNVCRTYDLDRETRPNASGPPTTYVFLTMEFLAGETLAARLKRSPRLTVAEIETIARDVAAALDAAHALGIVHRDIKPGNIMLVPPGENSRQPARVVITDFGLARLDPIFSDGEHSITHHSSHSNQPIGTLAYMAPEQMDGRPISAATDIYAFGLVLFEMATGQRAFPASNLLSGIALRLNGTSPSPRALNADLPVSIEQAVRGCLHLNPEDRFPSAQEVVACLSGYGPAPIPQRSNASAFHPKLRPSPGPRLTTLRLFSLAAILPVAVSLFLLGQRFSWWKGDPVVTPGALVYLAPVSNQTGDKSLDNITELLQASLEQSAHINLLDQGKAEDILIQMTKPADTPITEPIGREIALRTNAARVIFSSVTGSQGHYTLNVDIQRPEYTSPIRFRDHWAKSFTWQVTSTTNGRAASGTIPQELTSSLQNAADWIRREIGESQNDIGRLDIPPEEATTASWEALEQFSDATTEASKHDLVGAVDQFTRATIFDPSFALAYARIADLDYALGRSESGYQAYRHALDPSLKIRLTRRERDRIQGMFAIDTMDYTTAEEAFRDYSTFYEADPSGWAYRCLPLKMLGRSEGAVEALREVIKLNPKPRFGPATLGRYLLIDGHFDESQHWADVLSQRGDADAASMVQGQLDFLQFRMDQAEKSFLRLTKSSDAGFSSEGYSLLARLDAERGDLGRALEALDTGLVHDRAAASSQKEAMKLADEAYLEIHASRLEPGFADLLSALKVNANSYVMFTSLDSIGMAMRQPLTPHQRELTKQASEAILKLIPRHQGDVGASILLARVHALEDLLLGDADRALLEDAEAERLSAPASPHEFVAAAYQMQAKTTRSRETKIRAQTNALAALQTAVEKPGFIWHEPLHFPPGYLRFNSEEYLRAASALGRADEQTRAVEDRLRRSELVDAQPSPNQRKTQTINP